MSSENCKLFIALQYVLSNTSTNLELQGLLNNLISISNSPQLYKECTEINCNIYQLLESLVLNSPESIPLDKFFQIVHSFLSTLYAQNTSELHNAIDQSIDLESLFHNHKIPFELQCLIGLSDDNITASAEATYTTMRELLYKVHWLEDFNTSDSTTLEFYQAIFYQFVKARIFRVNYLISDFSFFFSSIDNLKSLQLYSSELENWVTGFLKPLANLSQHTTISPLVDWIDFMDINEQIDFVMNLMIDTNNYDKAINNTLVPYLSFINNGFSFFNDWLIKQCEKTIFSPNLPTERQLQILVQIITQDQLIIGIKTRQTIQNKFASIILSTIYLCPEASLDIFVNMKELLVTLESLDLPEGDISDTISDFPQKESINEMCTVVVPSTSLIKSLEKHVETAERLYANNMSLIEVVNLSNSSETKQLLELEKFIENESKYGKNIKQWAVLLSSIYWIFGNTRIFNKVPIKQLDQIVLQKLLDLRLFDIISNTFVSKYSTLSEQDFNQIVIKNAWTFYRKATNCDSSIGFLKSCSECLDLVKNPSENFEASQLRELIKANNELLNWKLYFEVGVPITPNQILDINDPLKIVSKILELNNGSYLETFKLLDLLKQLTIGLNCYDLDPLLQFIKEETNDSNPLVVKLQIMGLDFSTPFDFNYSYRISIKLLDLAVENKYEKPVIFELVQNNWFSFFQLVKTEYEEYEEFDLLKQKLNVLSKLMLVVPGDFNVNVLEQWQILHTMMDQMEVQTEHQIQEGTLSLDQQKQQQQQQLGIFAPHEAKSDIGSRFQRSLQSSANEILHNTESGDLGKNIIGWIVGAQ